MSELERPEPVASFTRADMLAIAVLLGGFIGMVLWFDRITPFTTSIFSTAARLSLLTIWCASSLSEFFPG